MRIWWWNIGPEKDGNSVRKVLNPVAPFLLSKGLDRTVLSALTTVTRFTLLGWFQSLYVALLGRCFLTLAAPASWGLHPNSGLTFTELHKGFSVLSYSGTPLSYSWSYWLSLSESTTLLLTILPESKTRATLTTLPKFGYGLGIKPGPIESHLHKFSLVDAFQE